MHTSIQFFEKLVISSKFFHKLFILQQQGDSPVFDVLVMVGGGTAMASRFRRALSEKYICSNPLKACWPNHLKRASQGCPRDMFICPIP